MDNIGIISNNDNSKALNVSKDIYDYLISKNINVCLLKNDALSSSHSLPSVDKDEFEKRIDCLISVGGDGTFLRAAKHVFKSSKPVMGVNVGNLGFLAEINVSDMYDSLDKIINNNFEIEQRMLISGSLLRDRKVVDTENSPYIALNDFVITKALLEKIIQIKIIINGISILNYGADGVIISTPTGSTAYSLSAGGPVVEPKNESIIITPICPHTLFSRSLVLSPDNHIEIQINSKDNEVSLNIDGKKSDTKIADQDIFKVEKCKYKLNLITFNKNIFFKIFKEKLVNKD
ncbi:MAG: NAD(+)/NADH kinase [Actinomycetota bacterium]|jgi:NAD+ kinase|nr:NAD(+)/NADH kinase [Actinomycetota bacterium]